MQVDEVNFLTYLKNNKPYLHDVELLVRRIREDSGYGDISIVFTMAHGSVERCEVISTTKRQYRQQVDSSK
jgi:hypothetical protein